MVETAPPRFVVVAVRLPQSVTASASSPRDAMQLVEAWAADGFRVVSVYDAEHGRITLDQLRHEAEQDRIKC